jgi:hypothetical protein
MTTNFPQGAGLALVALCALASPSLADALTSSPDEAVQAAFDIVSTEIVLTPDGHAVFRTTVREGAGSVTPEATGSFAGAEVAAYVWPTTLDSAAVGFEPGQGIVALAATFHPDFDDAAGGGVNHDRWHAHWVVLGKDAACPGGLKVIDIPEGTMPTLPATWPGVPLLIDSPDYKTDIAGAVVEVHVPLDQIATLPEAGFDGVTAGLRINADLHAPLLCVTDVWKIASGDLSLPGKPTQGQ